MDLYNCSEYTYSCRAITDVVHILPSRDNTPNRLLFDPTLFLERLGELVLDQTR